MQADAQQLWKELNADLERYVCDKVHHQDHCNDILQDVYLKMVDNIEKIPHIANVKGYLVRIAAHTIADHYRSSRNIGAGTEAIDEEPAPDCDCAKPLIAQSFIQRVIADLPAKYQEALVKIELEGMSQKDYAEFAGISLSGAKSRVQRAREQLKDLILQCCKYEFDRYGNLIRCCGQDL